MACKSIQHFGLMLKTIMSLLCVIFLFRIKLTDECGEWQMQNGERERETVSKVNGMIC